MRQNKRCWKAVISLSDKKTIFPGAVIGIIGGGQLGKMMAVAAKQMGYKVAVVDPVKDSPCGQIADIEITAQYNDREAIQKLAGVSDIITYEFENIDYEALNWLKEHAYLPQGSELLLITQNRETEKKAIQSAGCQVAPYRIVNSRRELEEAVQSLGLPAVLKTCRGGYDGKGQFVIKEKGQTDEAAALLENGACILESWVSFRMELSVIVTRSVHGEISTFPAAENIHHHNILFQSIVPARAEETVQKRAEALAVQLAEKLELVGPLAVEMFVTEDGDLLINELAPRPHNSGHYTLDLCETSQFEQHIRAVCGLPLGRTDLLKPGMMVNLLGDEVKLAEEHPELLKEAKLYLYGKHEIKKGRKMGHMTFLREPDEKWIQDITNIWMKRDGGRA
ncbi:MULTISPECIES: 5-(carboxyamino)imidazole ribonucleotide synthase [Bacillus]|uniref:N5-carboxyaminoimidazole ribonucleotide synthase n=1 Tax=Bacillus amyloliquefaciens (strain ATCC 23350 / DSM 7 / BCRC 11601 / CCUG 28519 / NBRC 15535 / NRRL B-14393 / F) TaxID=692420 RepID=A0A9P1JEJ9_BACAS|nr:5-(carboxyamino)imidazole ribonucleotide synthase [Bacillus amyloliquefaciens]AOC90132.1 5-(carboxyamino)imidazole ribonucleotide synthase [Bacillus amyloliquefaciens]ARW37853.1 5-(carboxyamino)imidazole ribonucleotide synthase [Bacillus amyloliquefaciens]AZV92100.1 phosphoribosylaminoimidazole carboxylase [Bacillus amyloliquefaciens]MBW8280358.1 5-(carboxyamino)imidazole ribonucleotide synthase [Bacillus amyloliquefaciens]MDR4378483.1 5-(carboxyamino)imidazole ribonucleotide synthase [Baci